MSCHYDPLYHNLDRIQTGVLTDFISGLRVSDPTPHPCFRTLLTLAWHNTDGVLVSIVMRCPSINSTLCLVDQKSESSIMAVLSGLADRNNSSITKGNRCQASRTTRGLELKGRLSTKVICESGIDDSSFNVLNVNMTTRLTVCW